MRYYLRTLCVLTSLCIHAQIKDTTYWNRNFELGLNLNQTSFNEDWKKAQGGLNSTALALFLNAKSEYVKFKHKLVNDLQCQLGYFTNEKIYNNALRKNADRLFFDNVYSYALSGTWSLFSSITFQSQFAEGNTYITHKNFQDIDPDIIKENKPIPDSLTLRVSNFLAPGYLDEGFGLMWSPVSFFSARLSAVAFRQTFVTDAKVFENNKRFDSKLNDTVALGVRKGNILRNQLGYNIIAKFDKDIVNNLNLKLIGQFFSAYENYLTGVSRLDAIVTAKITKYINVNLTAVLYFNPDQSLNVQANQQLALGIVYKRTNIK